MHAFEVDESLDGTGRCGWIRCVQLDGLGRFVRTERREVERAFVLFYDGASPKHFRDVQSRPEPPAKLPKRNIGHPGHGGEDDGRGDRQVADLESVRHA